jgi:hypothetical protein
LWFLRGKNWPPSFVIKTCVSKVSHPQVSSA